MSLTFDDTNLRLIDVIQAEFPIEPHPYERIGQRIGIDQHEVIARIGWLKQNDVVREISGAMDAARLGYHTTLAAIKADPDRLEAAKLVIASHPGVSHGYERDHAFNLWFTLAIPRERSLEAEVAKMAEEAGVQEHLVLPTIRRFKLVVDFNLGTRDESEDGRWSSRSGASPHTAKPVRLTEKEIRAVRALQRDLPLEEQPFHSLARSFDLEGPELIEYTKQFLGGGIIRRYGAAIRHNEIGFGANAMLCWVIPAERVEEAGKIGAAEPAVSHCYERPTKPPAWPYNFFTMLHARTEGELAQTIEGLHEKLQPNDSAALHTLREFKKRRVRYFENAS
jgi:DNA-binding Lrp family transcriptional regulator